MGTPTGAPTDPSFMGYLIQGTLTSARYCAPLQTFTTFDSIAACCPKASSVLCNYYSTCTHQCSASGFSCVSQTIYATYPTVDPHTHFVCVAPGWDWSILFRDIPASTSATLVLTQATPPPASASATSNTSTATSSPSATTSPSRPPATNNQPGLIAGVVIGVVVAIAILVAGLCLLRRRQKRWRAQNRIVELGASSPKGYMLQNQNPVKPTTDHINSSTTVVAEGAPVVSTVYSNIGEYYSKRDSPSPGVMFGAVPANAAAFGPVGPAGFAGRAATGGNNFTSRHVRHPSGSAGISPIGASSNNTQERRASDLVFSPLPIPVSELDAVDSAVKLELPTDREPEVGFMPSPAVSSDGERADRAGGDRAYDGDGDTSDHSDERLHMPRRRRS